MSEESAIPCGAFELLEPVGEGGMAEVWRARHVRQGVPVAVKIMSAEVLEGEGSVAMFREEVQAHASLNHPAIATVFDYGRISSETADTAAVEPGAPYLAMEFAPEGTLADGSPPSDWREVRAVLVAILDALSHSHARDIIHRDLKPSNILQFPEETGRSRWRLTDFGLAHALGKVREEGSQDVFTSAGTPHYSSPEQLRGLWRQFGPWTDLYQVGCVAYEFVCGQLPFSGSRVMEVAMSHLTEPRPALDAQFPVPEGLEAWIHRMMARDPSQRFRRAADAAGALANLQGDAAGSDLSEIVGPSPEREDDAESAETVLESPPETLQLSALEMSFQLPDSDGSEGTESSGAEGTETSEWAPDLEARVPDDWRLDRETVAGLGASSSWTEDTDRTTQREGRELRSRFMDVGLGLFGLREIPFVDRDAERDWIWRALRRSAETKLSRVALLESGPGTGKSRLAEWMARRGHELGACNLLKATHGRQGGPGHGLDGMVERWLRSWGLERDEVYEQAQSRLSDYRLEDGSVGDVDELAAGLTEMVRPTDASTEPEGSPTYRIANRTARYALLWRLLRRIARRRPVMLWLDDLHRGPDTAGFVQFLVHRDDDLPLLCLGTLRTADPAEHAAAIDRIEALRGDSEVQTRELQPLGPRDQHELISKLLPLDLELLDDIQERTEGHPLFAVQIVEDWVAHGLLEPTERGFQLAGDSAEALPDNLHQVWVRSIEHALRGLSESERADAWAALEVAATFGRRVDRDEWQIARRRLGVEPPDRLVDHDLVERGLVESRSDGWSFVHGMLAESLRRRAEEDGRLAELHRICAESLEELYDRPTGDVDVRCADHWIEAGELHRALEPLRRATEHFSEADLERAAELLDRRESVMNRCELPAADLRRAELRCDRAENYRRRGIKEGAVERARGILDEAVDRDDDRIAARAHRLLATTELEDGSLESATRHIERAEELFRKVGDSAGVTDCMRERALQQYFRGRYGPSRQRFERARDRFEGHGQPVDALRCRIWIGWCHFGERAFDRARSSGRAAQEEGEERGDLGIQSNALNLVGDAARLLGELNEALAAYREALRIQERLGGDTAITELNIAMTRLGLGRRETFDAQHEPLREKLIEGGHASRVGGIDLAAVARAAADPDDEQWRRSRERLEDSLETAELRTLDFPWLAEVAADAALEIDATDRASEMLEMAEEFWRELDAEERAEEVRERRDRLATG